MRCRHEGARAFGLDVTALQTYHMPKVVERTGAGQWHKALVRKKLA